MSVSNLDFRRACLSSLLHDLRVAYNCLSYHAKNSCNPYSLRVRDRLQQLSDVVKDFYSVCSHDFSGFEHDV